jgi:hypothetical protein
METIVVGDLHGDASIAAKALAFPGKVVFVGDYLDSFNFSREDQQEVLLRIITAIEENPEKVTALYGNHELSYLDIHMQCSGFHPETYTFVKHLKRRIKLCLQDYAWVQDYLISHAGISNRLLTAFNISYKEYLDKGRFNDIGRYRGGRSSCGGLFWCDWWNEFEPVPGLKQVVGHSSYRPIDPDDMAKETVVTKGEGDSISYNIDCLQHSTDVLLISEDGSAKPVSL